MDQTLSWVTSECTTEDAPETIDKDSSPTTVFIRKNIRKVTKEDESVGSYDVWQYDEAKLNRANYGIYVGELAEANAEYIAMMSDIDLDI